MGKREADDSGSRRAKKQKRRHQKRQNTKSPGIAAEAALEEAEAPTVVHEEEIECDGEVELPLNDETEECVDVEAAEEEEVENETSVVAEPVTPTPPPKATTSKGGGSSSKKSATKTTPISTAATAVPPAMTPLSTPIAALSTAAPSTSAAATGVSSNTKKSNKKRRESATSSDEERWLTAIESGKLEDVDDELKKIKDPKLMTARQRAMYERNQLDKEPSPGGELLMSLPNGYREKEKPQTAEDIQKAALKSQKRKQLADEKREKDKKKTMERLLKKQESNKQRAAARRGANAKAAPPMISYRNTLAGAYILLPPDHEFPLRAQAAREPPKRQLCGIAGCGQPKVYNCSKTNLPLCGFACYRKHLQAVRQIMC